MKLTLGIKTDPIEYRYSYDWLFEVLAECGIGLVQLGSFFELYSMEDEFFHELREKAARRNIRIKSCFTSHRELGGFFTNNRYLEKAARRNYEQYIHRAALLGADYMGSNPGAVYRDQMAYKPHGIECYLSHMRELMQLAHEKGLKGLTIEPMSCHAEPPSLPDEITYMLRTLNDFYQSHRSSSVPVYLCGDTSHGVADMRENILHDNFALFEMEIPYMAEFHLKNTDRIFNSTFGFAPDELKKGIVDLSRLKAMLQQQAGKFPVDEVTGYLEIGGPKTGRDYTDYKLKTALVESLQTLKKIF